MKKTSVRPSRSIARNRDRTNVPVDLGDLITQLSAAWGPPGREDEVRDIVVRHIAAHVEHIETSPLGAVHAVIRRGGRPRWMITAHMDQIGVIVSHVDPSGFARFHLLGRKDPGCLPGHIVRFTSGRIAVIRVAAGAKRSASSVDDLLLDFGGVPRSQDKIEVGDVGCLDPELRPIGNYLVGSNTGGRSAVAILVRTIQSLSRPASESQFAFSVQGEFGGDGGLTSAASLEPEAACVVCPAPAEDYPGGPADSIRLGGGPLIGVRHGSATSHPSLVELLESLAKKSKIGYQLGTFEAELPGSALPAARGGIRTVWLCLPCRGLGTTAEMVDMTDLDRTGRLLGALVHARQEWM
jgi:putative aminopeptidase FrvX